MALFEEGYNCAQSVFLAFSDLHGMDTHTAAVLSSSFGGGMGRLREVCGAVSGMFLVAGILYGYDDPGAREEKAAHYARIQELAKAFEEKNGSIVCRELLGLSVKREEPTPKERTAEYYKKRPCPELVEFVERGELDSPALTAYLARQLGPYAGRVDAAVLGCTHFPFARRAIRAALGGNVTLYDGSDGTARETLRQLVRRGWVRGGSHGVVTLENSLPSELPLSRRLLALPRED